MLATARSVDVSLVLGAVARAQARGESLRVPIDGVRGLCDASGVAHDLHRVLQLQIDQYLLQEGVRERLGEHVIGGDAKVSGSVVQVGVRLQGQGEGCRSLLMCVGHVGFGIWWSSCCLPHILVSCIEKWKLFGHFPLRDSSRKAT